MALGLPLLRNALVCHVTRKSNKSVEHMLASLCQPRHLLHP